MISRKLFLIALLAFIAAYGSLNGPLFAVETAEQLEAKRLQASGREKVVILSRLTELYRETNPQKAVDAANEALTNLGKVPDKKLEVEILNNLSWAYRTMGQYKLAIETAEKSQSISQKIGDKQSQASALNHLGITYNHLGDYVQSLDSFSKTLDIFKEMNSKKDMANALNNIGIVYDMLGSYETSLKYYLEALKIKEEVGDMGQVASTLNNIGVLYNILEYPEKALEYFNRALKINREANKKSSIAITLTNIGNVYLDSKQVDRALDYYRDALVIDKERADERGISTSLNNIGLVYFKMKKYKEAMTYFRDALKLKVELDDKRTIAQTMLNIAQVNRETGALKKAAEEMEQALSYAASINARAEMTEIYRSLYLVNEELKNHKAALTYLKKYKELSDEILDRKTRDKMLEREATYRLEKKENEIELLRRDRLIKLMTIKKQEILERVFIIGVFFLLGIIGLLFRMYRLKIRVNKQLAEAYKEVEMASRTDYLTGLSNRRDILEKIAYEKNRFERFQEPFVVVICDIDNFKVFNDTFGHHCGDFVLVKTAELLRTLVRKQDTVGRWGGEEFILLLPGTTREGGRLTGEKIRKYIAEQGFVFEEKTIFITMTFGIGVYDREMSIYKCLKEADEAMYKGKNSGKNCVAVQER
jgi:diguanylate cyclase (GGDEF)-like protein